MLPTYASLCSAYDITPYSVLTELSAGCLVLSLRFDFFCRNMNRELQYMYMNSCIMINTSWCEVKCDSCCCIVACVFAPPVMTSSTCFTTRSGVQRGEIHESTMCLGSYIMFCLKTLRS